MQNYHFPIAFLDAPEILNASVTPIPASNASPLQVIANLGVNNATKLSFIDTTGDYIGVYIGGVGNEMLRCIIGGGIKSTEEAFFPAHSRVSLRSMTSTAITNGQLVMTFVSY